MKVKGNSSTVRSLLLVFSLLVLFPSRVSCAPDIDSRIKDEQGRLESIERQISYHQKQISEARRKEQGLLDELSRPHDGPPGDPPGTVLMFRPHPAPAEPAD